MAYTPIFDSLFGADKKINLTDVAIFGAVWRFSQGKLKKCTASPDKIGERVGVSPNTARTSLKKLCSLELLKDLTPNSNSKAHEYLPTSKALEIVGKKSEEETPILNERVPEIGTQELATSDNRVPEIGTLGYQKLVGGVPEIGTKDSNNRDIEERENAQPQDYLATVIEQQGKVTDKPDSNPEDQYFEYRDEFLSTYRDMTGQYPEPLVKDEISSLITIGITPAVWVESWRQCKLNWSGKNKIPLARVIEVCKFGGDYEQWRKFKYPEETNGRDSPPKPKLKLVPVTQQRDEEDDN